MGAVTVLADLISAYAELFTFRLVTDVCFLRQIKTLERLSEPRGKWHLIGLRIAIVCEQYNDLPSVLRACMV